MSAEDPIRRCHCGQWYRGDASSCSGESRVYLSPLREALLMAERTRGVESLRWLSVAIQRGIRVVVKEP